MIKGKASVKRRVVILACAGGMIVAGCGGKTAVSEGSGTVVDESALTEQNEAVDAADDPAAGEENNSDMAAINDTENADTEVAEENLTLQKAQIRHYYGGILSQITASWQFPDRELDTSALSDGIGSMADNHFAVTDIDSDGREELIVQYTNASMAGMCEMIYDYDPAGGGLKCEFSSFPALTYYSNGIIKAEASHNQGWGEFWPYILYRYDAEKDSYVEAGSVESWDKAHSETWFDGRPFPDELDTDGDGTLFIIGKEGGEASFGYEDFKYNRADVDEWFGGYLAGAPEDAKEITIDYRPLKYEAYADFTPDFLRIVAGRANSERTDTDADLGLLILRDDEEHYLNAAKKLLAEKYGVTMEQLEENFEEYTVGLLGGEERFSFTMLDSGDLCYMGEKVEDITIFGIYPGISVDGAWQKLKAYGFYASPYGEIENCLITGEGFGNVEIWFDAEDGKVTTITVRPFCAYSG